MSISALAMHEGVLGPFGRLNLCSAHLARITRCKLLQPLRHRWQFMYLTTVKLVLRKSFDLNYLRKMCGTWA